MNGNADGENITMIGDSVMIGAYQELISTWPDAVIDTAVDSSGVINNQPVMPRGIYLCSEPDLPAAGSYFSFRSTSFIT
jgi:hypothetical protein